MSKSDKIEVTFIAFTFCKSIYEIAMTPFVINTNKDLAIPYFQNLNIIYI